MKKLFSVTFSALLCAPLLASADAPKHIDVSQLPSQTQMIDNIVVPVPSEVFGALDKFGTQNWHSVLDSDKVEPIGDRSQIALMLGSVIAEGFIAVEAQESEGVKTIGRSVLSLAKAINVQKSVIARTNSIRQAADAKNWSSVRSEFDGALHDVKVAMVELNDEQLAQLVSLGGWLRGTDALTTLVSNHYTKESAELLHQPVMVEYFQQQINGFSPRLARTGIVKTIKAQLPELHTLVSGKDGEISPQDVAKIHKIVASLVATINAKSNPR